MRRGFRYLVRVFGPDVKSQSLPFDELDSADRLYQGLVKCAPDTATVQMRDEWTGGVIKQQMGINQTGENGNEVMK